MSMTFQKRQKELKRQEKQRAKVERREQKKFAKRAAKEAQGTPTTTSVGHLWLANCYGKADFTGNRAAQVNWPSLSERIRWQ